MDAAEERLGFPLAPALRQLFSYADGQQAGSPPLLVVPSNRHVTFLSLRQARDLALYWQEQARHPLQAKYWQGYNRLWVPIGWASKFHVALCVSSSHGGRVIRFTTPDAQFSHAALANQHLAENLEGYLADLYDHMTGARQPFAAGPKGRSNPAAGL
mmetsp:Transcript_57044/g.148209  ORF Transcript_57044/g.148209 Transcript_57044/m.148209 type:complete len:157 (-) Transcript_57044:11-481(-)